MVNIGDAHCHVCEPDQVKTKMEIVGTPRDLSSPYNHTGEIDDGEPWRCTLSYTGKFNVVNVVNGTRDHIMHMVASTSLVDAPFKEK